MPFLYFQKTFQNFFRFQRPFAASAFAQIINLKYEFESRPDEWLERRGKGIGRVRP